MNGQFYLVSYEMVAQNDETQIMIARLVKETEVQGSGLIGVKNEKKKGFAGEMNLHIYDEAMQEQMKRHLGGDPFEVRIG